MKKITNYLVLIIILFNFIFCNSSYAVGGVTDPLTTAIESTGVDGIKEDTVPPLEEDFLQSGIAPDTDSKGNEMKNQVTWDQIKGTTINAIVGILFSVFDFLPMTLQLLMTAVSYDGQNYSEKRIFTIEDMLFDKYEVFSVNYLDYDGKSEMVKTFRKSVAKYYYIFRLISLALSLVILIYVGIRMALSTAASDKSKYKMMFMGWIESMVILFMLQYIIAAFIDVGGIFMNAISKMKENMVGTSFETNIIITISNILQSTVGWNFVLYSIIFSILIFIQTKFFLAYTKRMLTVGFLILISPLITVVYSIDKAGDGKSQSFSKWMTELGVNIFIQPVEALIYLVFMYSAGEIAKTSILVAMIFLLGLTRIETIVFQLFHVKGMSLHMAHDQRKKG